MSRHPQADAVTGVCYRWTAATELQHAARVYPCLQEQAPHELHQRQDYINGLSLISPPKFPWSHFPRPFPSTNALGFSRTFD